MSQVMQEDCDSLCDAFKRLDRYRVSQNITWKDVAHKLGVGVSMLMMIKTGQRNLGKKALFKLEQAEIEAGIITPNRQPLADLERDSNSAPVRNLGNSKKLKISEIEKAIQEIKKAAIALNTGVLALEKTVEELKKG